MADEKQESGSGSAAGWFLKKFFTTPATYLGFAAAFGVMKASLGVDMPMGGAIGGGIMVGFAVGMLSFLIAHGIKASHQRSLESGSNAEEHVHEESILESLKEGAHSEEAELLEKMAGDRDAISKRCQGDFDNGDAAHTLELTNAILAESWRQSEELVDLLRRAEDPLLASPDGAEEKIGEIREDLRSAYRAVADARSRLRRGEKLEKENYFFDAEELKQSSLASMTARLSEETAISRRVEERLRSDFSHVVFSEDDDESPEKNGEASKRELE